MEKNNNGLISGILIIISFLLGMFADNFINKTEYEVPGKPQAAKHIDSAVQKALAQNGQLPSVVFAVTRNGNMQAFVPEGSKVITPKFPLHAENIVNVDSITIFETSNPKVCWHSLSGDQQCVAW